MIIFKKENFEKFMKEHNLTKTQFCKNCGISVATYNGLIYGRHAHLMSFVKIEDYTGFLLQDMFSFKWYAVLIMGSVESAQDDSEGCLHTDDFAQDDI